MDEIILPVIIVKIRSPETQDHQTIDLEDTPILLGIIVKLKIDPTIARNH